MHGLAPLRRFLSDSGQRGLIFRPDEQGLEMPIEAARLAYDQTHLVSFPDELDLQEFYFTSRKQIPYNT